MFSKILSGLGMFLVGAAGGALVDIFHVLGRLIHSPQLATPLDIGTALGSATLGGILVWSLRSKDQAATEYAKALESWGARYDARWKESTDATVNMTAALVGIKTVLEGLDKKKPAR